MKVNQSNQSLNHVDSGPAGTWRLSPQKAITLMPSIDAKISTKIGGLWITMSPRNSSAETDPSAHDLFLAQGETMVIPRDAVVVMEPWSVHGFEACYFTWDALTPELTLPVRQANQWTLQIALPWQDLKIALGQVVAAAGRLVRGALGLAAHGPGLAECKHGPAQI